MTARWLRWMVLVLAAWSAGWLMAALRGGGFWAWLAFGLPLLVPGLIVGAQFLLARRANRRHGLPLPPWPTLLRAWWVEWWLSIAVFGWLQPFRATAWPDLRPAAPGRRGVVLVHGFSCNRGMWRLWLRALTRAQRPFAAPNLTPPWGPIEAHVDALDAAVRQMHARTGLAPLLVCHSMGGLVARAWLGAPGRLQAVHRVVTLGTPHAGTELAQLDLLGHSRQMRPGHPWLQTLDASLPAEARARFICWLSDCDSIVFPMQTARLAGAPHREVPGLAHMEMAFDMALMAQVLALADLDM